MLTWERRSTRSNTRQRVSGLAASILVHIALLLMIWLRPGPVLHKDASSPLTIIDLPTIPVEAPEVVTPLADAKPVETLTNAEEGGLSSDRPPPQIKVPVPSQGLDLQIAASEPIAPMASPSLADTRVTRTEGSLAGGSGAATGVGVGAGLSGTGTGTGKGNGSGAKSGDNRGFLQIADWIERPTDEEMLQAYPYAARVATMSGTVLLSCQVSQANRARNCLTIKEVPRGYGFARAARDVVRRGLIRPPIAGERNLEDRVFVSITFETVEVLARR